MPRTGLSKSGLRWCGPRTVAYDALGNLVGIEVPGDTDDYVLVWDGDHIIAAMADDETSPRWDAVFSPTHQDKLLEFYDHDIGLTEVPLVDHTNSVIGVWNSTQGQMSDDLARYSAEGLTTEWYGDSIGGCDETQSATTICTAPGNMPFGFNSLYESPNTGLVYMCRERSDQMPLGCATAGTRRDSHSF